MFGIDVVLHDQAIHINKTSLYILLVIMILDENMYSRDMLILLFFQLCQYICELPQNMLQNIRVQVDDNLILK